MATKPQKSIITTDMCFGCGKNNPLSLKLNFKWDGKTAKAKFTPNKFHQGFTGIVHGGVISTILDEAMGQAAYRAGIKCVTGTMLIRFKRPLSVGEPVIVTASVTKQVRRLVEIEAKMTLLDGTPVAEAQATEVIPSWKAESEE